MKQYWNKYEACLKELINQIDRAKLQNCYLLDYLIDIEKFELLKEGYEFTQVFFKSSADDLKKGISLFQRLESSYNIQELQDKFVKKKGGLK